ncbi:MAG: hypothetical protein ABSB49_01870 [Polyangia bacterium]
MRRFGLSCLALLFILTSAKAEASKAGSAKKSKGPAPIAKEADVKEFKGEFSWGMTPQQVMDKLYARIDASYKDKVAKYQADPAMMEKLRDRVKADKDAVAKSYVKFDGQGQHAAWSTSIIDEEFLPNQGESMLIYREAKSRRYFFFSGEALYKMFVAFDKEVVEGKTFAQFGDLMQAKYGKAQSVYREVASHGVKDKVLDAFQWRSPEGDGLRLVDRSRFYDVYCLVIYDRKVADRQDEIRKSQAANEPKGGQLVDSVITDKGNDRDENDNVVDRITGQEVLKPGERRGPQNIKVPSPHGMQGGEGQ